MNGYLTALALLLSLPAVAQLWVGSAGIRIEPGATLTIDGLSLTPSTSLTIANNSIQKTTTPVAGSPSINRLYQLDSPLLFTGSVGINYLTSELNGYAEPILQIAHAPAANTALTVTTSSTVNTAAHYVSNSVTNQNLFVITATTLSDLTLLLYARPTTISSMSELNLVIDVVEINSVATNGLFTVRVTKDAKLNLNFPPNATQVGGRPVQNSAWSFSNTDPNYYILSTSQSVPAGDRLSFGLTGMLSPGATNGVISISTILLPTNIKEAKLTNNSDSDKVEYFQQ
ncbi:hypothetical protein [Spirosoma validum]|uniref:DUF4397 domain-containing protein n=1 Tax=Spirosoma validum TaxID=2771355 RepID=A0A927B8P0_9BACT|nr:hypothetical protein [Spirosoma validum]MBD2757182.1 hypothetical protein [Spirosoma validum]